MNLFKWGTSQSIQQTSIDLNTVLLLHLDGNVVDSEPGIPKTVTNYNVTFGNASSKFDYYAIFNGQNSNLTIPFTDDFYFADQPFTIDFWYNPTDVTYATYFDFYTNGGNRIWMWYHVGTCGYQFYAITGGTTVLNFYTEWLPIPNQNTWYHIALVRIDNGNSLNSWRFFINGVQKVLYLGEGSWNAIMPNVGGNLNIGVGGDGNFLMRGHLDEYRITKGKALWTSNFTPPTAPYGIKLSKTRNSDAYVVPLNQHNIFSDTIITELDLLLHLDNNVIDSSVKSNVVTNVGVTFDNVNPINSNFSSYAVFDGQQFTYLSFPDNGFFDFGYIPFTIDFWVNFTDFTEACFIGQSNGDDEYINAIFWEGYIHFFRVTFAGGGTGFYFTWLPTTGVWYHIAVVRIDAGYTSDSWRVFIDGISQTLTGANWNRPMRSLSLNPNVMIGNLQVQNGYGFNGAIDEMRVTRGIALWTENFTPPTVPGN